MQVSPFLFRSAVAKKLYEGVPFLSWIKGIITLALYNKFDACKNIII